MSKTVLVVDDSSAVRTLVRGALEGKGYGVVEAGDGEEAMKSLQGRSVNLVICDLHMPRMDGESFIKQLRQAGTSRFVPVLLLTTETRPEVKQRLRAAGASGFIGKPCAPTQLLTAVQRLCA